MTHLRALRWSVALLAAVALTIACACSSGAGAATKLIVYEASDRAGTNVFTIDPKTAVTVQLTQGAGFSGNPGWSPDRKHVVFTSDRGNRTGQNDLYVMDQDGRNARAVTDTPDASEWSPKYSPDGKRIAYAARAADGAYSIDVMNSDGSGAQAVAGPYKFAEFPAWTRDGTQVYFAAISPGKNDSDIFSVDPATSEVRARIATPGGDLCPHFSHDGEYVTYATAAAGERANVDLFRHELSSDDTTGAADERLTEASGSDDYGNPSPDDKQYVFVSQRDGDFELYLMDADGSNQRRLTHTPGVRENVPDW